MPRDILSIVVPSRDRPENIARLADRLEATTSFGTKFLVVVDDDDPKLREYWLAMRHRAPWMKLVVNSELHKLNPILNHYALQEAATHDFVAFLGDDHLPQTPGWDRRLCQSLLGRPGVAYGNDLLQSAALPTACVISSDVVRGLGWFSPPPLEHLFMDNFWKMLGQVLGNLKYLQDVIIEHVHPAAGKAEWTDAYRRTCGAELMYADQDRFARYMEDEWPGDLLRLGWYLRNGKGSDNG